MAQHSMTKFLEQDSVKNYIAKTLKGKQDNFTLNVTALANSSPQLKACDPNSLLAVAISATALGLDINPNLGYAWAVPYKEKATFQIGSNGYKQLAMRTNKYEKINVTKIYENQFISWNPLYEELEINLSVKPEGKVHGYAAYFKRKDGFSKTIYWTREQVEAHGKKYSKSYNSKSSPWQTSFDKMAEKTVIKDLLRNWAELSTEQNIQQAIQKDQSAININFDTEEETIEYVDNPQEKDITPRVSKEQASKLIELAKGRQEDAMMVLSDYGYSDIKAINEDDFEDILKEFQLLNAEVVEPEAKLPFDLE